MFYTRYGIILSALLSFSLHSPNIGCFRALEVISYLCIMKNNKDKSL